MFDSLDGSKPIKLTREKPLLVYSCFESLGSSLEKPGVTRLAPLRLCRVELQLSVFFTQRVPQDFHHTCWYGNVLGSAAEVQLPGPWN